MSEHHIQNKPTFSPAQTEAITRLLRLAQMPFTNAAAFLAQHENWLTSTTKTSATDNLFITHTIPNEVAQHAPDLNIGTLITLPLSKQPDPPKQLGDIIHLVLACEESIQPDSTQRQALMDVAWFLADELDTAHLSQHDTLTGLLNQTGFETIAEQALKLASRTNTPSVLICFDIENFASVNQHYGNEGGDKVLSKLAIIMTDTFRESDIIARFSADKFVVLLTDATTQDAQSSCERLAQAINTAANTHPAFTNLTFIAGIAASRLLQGESINELILRAEQRTDHRKHTPIQPIGALAGLDEQVATVTDDDEPENLL
ncbi:MAG: GGDEF domain-containing protein [Pontibacterium sp.]